MYEAHWNLEQRPFDAKVDAGSYFASDGHQAAALKLHYAMEQRRSVAVLCGEPGVGKSMILENCLAQLPDYCSPIARVVYPAMPAEQLLKFVVRQMGPHPTAHDDDTSSCVEQLERILRHNVAEDLHAILAIDEAHLLQQYGSLESLRLLLNLASDVCKHESCLTLVLCGSTSLISHLAKHPALEDRVTVRCVIERFTLEETTAYIQHRLQSAGRPKTEIFSTRSVETIHQLTCGVPRKINRLCDLSLMIGFAQDLQSIDPQIVEMAHAELSSFRQAAA